MDTLIKRGFSGNDRLAELRNHRFLVGTKQLRKTLNRGGARLVFLAGDADPAITEPLAQACEKAGVECVWVARMNDLGRACGIDVGAAAVCIVAED